MDIKSTLTELSMTPGPSGQEDEVKARAAELLRGYSDDVSADRFGNIVARLPGTDTSAPKLLLDAHLDEVGLVITSSDEGFLRFRAIGGVDARILPASEILILGDTPLRGVIMTKPPHILKKNESDRAIAISDMFIDAGLSRKEAAGLIGRKAVFAGKCAELGTGRFSGKALDDRSCFTAILRALELLSEWYFERRLELIVMASLQEEVGCRGAAAGAFEIAPDYCVAVDVTHGDTPDAAPDKTFRLGGGPAIGLGPGLDRNMSGRLISLAEEKGIKYQLEVMEGSTGTNSWPIQVVGAGTSCAMISLPLRYMHTPVEVIDLDDFELTARLIAEYVIALSSEV